LRVLWLPEALDDVERLCDFLIEKDATAAERAVRTISSSAESLQDLPQIGRPMDDDTGRRELVVPFGAGAYVLRYRIHRDAVVIIRVWHSRELRE
jgi:plasmid stabilization system protein ParE